MEGANAWNLGGPFAQIRHHRDVRQSRHSRRLPSTHHCISGLCRASYTGKLSKSVSLWLSQVPSNMDEGQTLFTCSEATWTVQPDSGLPQLALQPAFSAAQTNSLTKALDL